MFHRIEVSGTSKTTGIFTWMDTDGGDDFIMAFLAFDALEDPRLHGCKPPYECWFTSAGYKKFRKYLRHLTERISSIPGVTVIHRTLEPAELTKVRIVYEDPLQIAILA